MEVKEESEKAGLKLNIKTENKTLISWYPVLLLHGKQKWKKWK